MNYIIGQGLGLLSTVCTIILPFFKKKWQILSLNIAVNLLLTLNFLLIGQFGSAMFLCLVAVVQSIVSIFHSVKNTKVTLPETILFAVLYVGFGVFGILTAPGFVWALNFDNLLEILPIIGALMLMISVFAPDEQTTRKWLLANALTWTVYTAIVGSTAFFTDLVAAVSTASALYKYRKK
ncbi:MAG: YgjV family protein [Oscillospiraceae bacterium]|nr:YgjV family protein [Oscillospiraceae bacterium]